MTSSSEGGLPSEKIAVKPNFVEDDHSETKMVFGARKGALFVGRLGSEKGVRTPLAAWRTLDIPLTIAGDGLLLAELRAGAPSGDSVLGRLSSPRVADKMGHAAFLVVSSECYEGFRMVIAEAFCHALPVLASRLGSLAELVEDRVTGLHFNPGDPDDLAAKVRWAHEHPVEMAVMGRNARRRCEERYTPERNYTMVMTVYAGAIAENRARHGAGRAARMPAAAGSAQGG